jgi:hypothetical protein
VKQITEIQRDCRWSFVGEEYIFFQNESRCEIVEYYKKSSFANHRKIDLSDKIYRFILTGIKQKNDLFRIF